MSSLLGTKLAFWAGCITLQCHNIRSIVTLQHVQRRLLTLVLRRRHDSQIFLGLPCDFGEVPSALLPLCCIVPEAVPVSAESGAGSSTGSGRINSSRDWRLCILNSFSAVLVEAGPSSGTRRFRFLFFLDRRCPSPRSGKLRRFIKGQYLHRHTNHTSTGKMMPAHTEGNTALDKG